MPKQQRTPNIVDGYQFSEEGHRLFPRKQAPYILEVRESAIAGRGLFVKAGKISRDEVILSYTGPLLTSAAWGREWDKRYAHVEGPCIQRLDYFSTSGRYMINGENSFTSYVNHSCDPNVEAICLPKNVLFKALREIFPEEELFIDYNLEGASLYPCECGMEACRGFMNNEENIKKTLRTRITARAKKGTQ